MSLSQTHEIFHDLKPGLKIKGDWHDFPIPMNIRVGTNSVIDSSFCFKKYFSQLAVGLSVGDNVTLQSTELGLEKNAYLEIGDYSYISSACIAAFEKVIIGRYVFIAGGVTIVDTDFHPIDPSQRMLDTVAVSTIGDKSRRPAFDTAPVIIEDGVWIGYNATILKGVTIGKNSVIQPGALVTKNIPANSIVSGNPAVIERLEHV
jgi:acetyltransferase-like isoleucine patch superfamily enzyme